MSNKKLMPVLAVALLLIVGAALAMGASGSQQVRIPQGQIVTSPNASSGVVDTGRPTIPDAPAAPPASAKAVFSDDFSADSIGNYQPLADAPGSWVVRSKRLQQRGAGDEVLSDAPAVLLARGATFSNNALTAQVFPVAMPVGLVFRASDAGYYRLTLRRQQPNTASKALLEKVVAGHATEIASAPTSAYAGFTPNQWQTVRVNAVGSRITVTVEGNQILSATDPSYTSGSAGVWATADATTQFDNVRIEDATR